MWSSWSTLLWYRCFYPHLSRDALSPVCGIFFCMFDFLYHFNNWIFIEWTSLVLRVNNFFCRWYTVGLSWLIPSWVVFFRLSSCTCFSLVIFLSPLSSEWLGCKNAQLLPKLQYLLIWNLLQRFGYFFLKNLIWPKSIFVHIEPLPICWVIILQ